MLRCLSLLQLLLAAGRVFCFDLLKLLLLLLL